MAVLWPAAGPRRGYCRVHVNDTSICSVMGLCSRSASALLILVLGLSQGLPASGAEGPDAEACLGCHGEKTFQGERNGKPRPLFVDGGTFAKSVHAAAGCVGCHADLQGSDFPHAAPLKPVDCGACHGGQQALFADSLHGKALAKGDPLAPRCASCHGSHAIMPVKSPESSVLPMKVPYVCGSCHSEGSPVMRQRNIHQHEIVQNYSISMHGEGLLNKGLSVSATCTSCHTAHHILPHTDARSSIARGNISRTCMQCHAQIESVHRKIIDGKLWESKPNAIPACVDCHQPHKVRKVFYEQGMANRDCMTCHGNPNLRRAADAKSLYVKLDALKDSPHSETACAQCHTGVTPSKVRTCATVIKKVDCSICHGAVVQKYATSVHGALFLKGDPNAPACAECHGEHGMRRKSDRQSNTFPTNVPKLCARCHREGEKAALRYKGAEHEITGNYTESIHGKGLLKSGLTVTAMCTNCHTAHAILPAQDPASSVNERNIPNTCSQCHNGIYEQFAQSIHATGKAPKGGSLPTCRTCHSAHSIQRADADQFRIGIMQRCGQCHGDVAETYFETYHGKVSQLGYGKTAKCHDCHGAHDIFAVNDTRSRLSRQNILETCRKCHPGAGRRFAGYLTHSTHNDPKKYPLIFLTFWAMTALLVGTFIGAGVHTLLWLPKSLQMRREHPPEEYDPAQKQYMRFEPRYRVMHVVMVSSFLLLAMTGMTLKFSYTRWAVLLSHLFGGFVTAGYLHRLAAVVMFGLFLFHLRDLFQRLRGAPGGVLGFLFGPDTMMFTWRDLREVFETMKWYLGRGPRPQYGRWTYWEKFDYFAVFWGIAIIGSTGVALWFPELVTHVLPGWMLNVATIVHSDEALLASGFIFTIHFFNTHFRPEKFPMDISIFTGRVSVGELKRERPDEYAALVASGGLEARLIDPLPPYLIRAIRIFGWTALTLGLVLVVCIIYAMLFSYK
ncbi:MAG TPA: hypothetical protein DD417_19385 [Elusimicrobia bacterium]|nr:hypothetical protein [Elusimicrobiota bacterium]